MRLQEIFDQLTTGEFSQLCIGGAEVGVIDSTNYPKVLNHVNLALTALFRRFKLKEGQLVLQLQEDQNMYKLVSTFAVNSRRSQEAVRYIIDTASEPFLDDLMKVERVLTEDDCDLGVNDANDALSVTTPSALVLLVPADIERQDLTVVYRASHPKLKMGLGYFDPARIEVQLPDTHLDALLNYVGSRVQSPVGMANEGNLSSLYAAKYEQACQELENKGLQVDKSTTNDRLTRNGWA